MKVLNEKDYTYVGYCDGWHVFESKPKQNYDPEKVYVKRVRFIKEDGQSVFYEAPNN